MIGTLFGILGLALSGLITGGIIYLATGLTWPVWVVTIFVIFGMIFMMPSIVSEEERRSYGKR